MTKQKLVKFLNELAGTSYTHTESHSWATLNRGLEKIFEQHEAFKQEVSDAVEEAIDRGFYAQALQSLIIPAPKPDPLVEVLHEVDTGPEWDSPEDYCNKIRAALDARGLTITTLEKD